MSVCARVRVCVTRSLLLHLPPKSNVIKPTDVHIRPLMIAHGVQARAAVNEAAPLPDALVQHARAMVASACGNPQIFGMDLIRERRVAEGESVDGCSSDKPGSGSPTPRVSESADGDCEDFYVVDVNHFPGFHGMESFADALAALIQRRCVKV